MKDTKKQQNLVRAIAELEKPTISASVAVKNRDGALEALDNLPVSDYPTGWTKKKMQDKIINIFEKLATFKDDDGALVFFIDWNNLIFFLA